MKKYQTNSVEWTLLTQDDMRDWSESPDLENITETTLFEEESESGEEKTETAIRNGNDVFMEHMDIREPIEALRDLLAPKLGFSLKNFDFWLQDTNLLHPNKNLVDQCIQGEGLVQINCQINKRARKINIVDILKPSNEVLAKGKTEAKKDTKGRQNNKLDDSGAKRISESGSQPKASMVTNHWAIDNQFKRDQARLRIPDNPSDWNKFQVKFWLNWAKRQFSTAEIQPDRWDITGEELCSMTVNDFKQKCRKDPGDLFWTHLELLRKCKYVAVLQKNGPPNQGPSPPKRIKTGPSSSSPAAVPQQQTTTSSVTEGSKSAKTTNSPTHHRTSFNGQIQLWQFLLDLLTDVEYINIIQWDGYDGQFKLLDPGQVAQLWGIRKNKPYMNYEKLSRALRYYYDGDMIAKVQGKRFVYKFVCNLQQLIGYNARELAQLVQEQS